MDFREIGAPGCSGASILLTRLPSRVGRFFLQLLHPGAWAEHPLQSRVGMWCGRGALTPKTAGGHGAPVTRSQPRSMDNVYRDVVL